MDGKREEVNILQEREVRRLGIEFIKQDNIRDRDLDRYGLHLNINESKVVTGNFVDFLIRVWLCIDTTLSHTDTNISVTRHS